MSITIEGALAILPGGIEAVDVTIEDGRIATVGEHGGQNGARRIDARGLVLAPALVDVHGDAFERQVMPRAGVFFPMETAILDTDRQLAAAGIATAYHAVTLSWEPGLRSVARGRNFIETVAALTPRLTVEHRIQLRWETFAFEAEELIADSLARAPYTPSIAFNDHTSMALRAFGPSIQNRAFEQSPDFEIAALNDDRLLQRVAGDAKRAGLAPEAYVARLGEIWERRGDVDGGIRRVAAAGHAAGAPMLSHDDTRLETRSYYRALGARVAEFPMVFGVAEAARAKGDTIIFGAPNAVRGGSHIGSLAAADMVEAGLCDALASDYYYPAMLAAIARLDREKRAPRHTLWSLVSDGPARAMGLRDRGRIEVGLRADLVLLDWPDGQTPAVLATVCAGRMAFQAQPFEA
ncbi:MAG: alpha-D-ribose 1-methylphosphonate 5-triphosphate diphosphatase [Pseudomonadota bacterium]